MAASTNYRKKGSIMIKEWLSSFTSAWIDHDVNKIMELFDNEVEYWETPHKRLDSINEVRQEWQAILGQEHIELDTKVFSSDDESHSVVWHLSYAHDGKTHHWAGTYLLRLNDQGKCTYFYHTGEKL